MKKTIGDIFYFIGENIVIILLVIFFTIIVITRCINDGYYKYKGETYYKHNGRYYIYYENDWERIEDENFKIDLEYKVSYDDTHVMKKFNGFTHLIDYVGTDDD